MPDNTITAAMDALRVRVKAAYGIADGVAIPEAGDDPVEVVTLPMAALATEGAAQIQRGPAARDRSKTFSVVCWLLRKKTSGTRDVENLRAALEGLEDAINAEMQVGTRLDGTALLCECTEMDWTGEGRSNPFKMEGVGAHAGYVTVEMTVTNSLPTA